MDTFPNVPQCAGLYRWLATFDHLLIGIDHFCCINPVIPGARQNPFDFVILVDYNASNLQERREVSER